MSPSISVNGKVLYAVVGIDVGSKGLVGSLSPHIGNLSFLRMLRLSNNTLQGKIPPQLGNLFRLQILFLTNNSFEGEIPANLSHCSNLTVLRIANNKLVGKLPKELGSLSKLTILSIYGNHLTGNIPPFFGNLTSLKSISATENLFSGSLPDALGQLKNLRELGFGDNNLSGMVPSSIYNLSLLTTLSLAQNHFHGSLPLGLGSMFPQLLLLQIWGNQFTGTLPLSLSNCSQLESIDISWNNFDGKVAINFGGLPNLGEIFLELNSLGSGEPDEMNFIDSMANCSNLVWLAIEDNQFRDLLPNAVGNLSNQLYNLTLGRNLIHGSIPSAIGNLVNLNILGLEKNQFIGTIPDSLGNLRKIRKLDLNGNKLSGKIPDSVGNFSMLLEVSLGNNKLEGNIPPGLAQCKKMLALDLSQNNLNGTIPKELLRVSALSVSLNLGQNNFSGSLPSEVGNLKILIELDLSENELSGEIPSTLGGCISLENLYLKGNFFNASIPPSLSSLRGIQNFDLSRNNFSGHIPRFLEHFALKNLNLSFNDFEGVVPMKGVFTNASAISLVGNSKLCGGIPALQLPKCSMKKQKWSLTLKIIIPVACTLLVVSMVIAFWFCWVKRKRKAQPSGSLFKEPFMKVSYERLLKATDGFSPANLIGVGSYGSVYKGILDQEETTLVAVKVINLLRRGASKSFMAECEVIRSIRHQNLVKVITSCSSIDFQGNDFKALVYEFMPNGSLEKWLHSSSETNNGQSELQSLNLLQRINIAIDVACALEYLHHQCQTPIVHCDLKPSNVLLDSDLVAHVGDFGLARFLQKLINPKQSSSIGIKGTVGYAAPEYGMGSEVSAKGDVYSYGIVVLEMMTGKRPIDSMFKEGLNLHNFARTALPDRVMQIVDPILLNIDEEGATTMPNRNRVSTESRADMRKKCLTSMIKIGVACSMESPHDRMDITDVVHELNMVRNILRRTPTEPNYA